MLGLACKSLGWFLAGVAVALGFLVVPVLVANERKKLDHTASDIVAAQREIRVLQTEIETRASLTKVGQWNAGSLKLVAPTAGQFVADEPALAQIDPNRPVPVGAGDVAAPQLAFVPGTPVDVVAPDRSPAPVAAAPRHPPRAAMAATVTPARKPQAVALLDRALLDDSVIGDLSRGARAEMGGGR